MKKIPVGILGATGRVGQKFAELLSFHPWFELVSIGASERSQGKKYREVIQDHHLFSISEKILDMKILPCDPARFPCFIVFSALDSRVAKEIEAEFAKAGIHLFSNTKCHRMDLDVPLLVPEVNADHLELLRRQTTRGKIVTNPNCSTIGLVLPLKPLDHYFGLQSVHVVTLQAVSGAGFKALKTLNIEDNVIPFIREEEEKMERESLKILGSLTSNGIQRRSFRISAQCNRVPVSDGHLECVSVSLKKRASKSQIIQIWQSFEGEAQKLNLPLAPKKPLCFFEEESFTQPQLHKNLNKGMTVSLGRLQECSCLDYKFVLLSHNTIRGGAGGAILNAELAFKKEYLTFSRRRS